MKKYMVQFRKSAHQAVSVEKIKAEQQILAELMKKNFLINVHMSKDMSRIWMEFRLSGQEELLEIIKVMPHSKDLYCEVFELI